MAKRTTQENLDYALGLVAKYTADIAAERIRDNIEVGDEVTFSHGRAETKRELQGTVKGVKDGENGRWVAISVGEGFDEETFKVRTADISSNPAADKRLESDAPAPTPAVEKAPLTPAQATVAAKAASAASIKDPLASN